MITVIRTMLRRAGGTVSRLPRENRGQAAVEFALVLPVFLLLVVLMVEMSRLWGVHHALTEAARQGARTASLANTAIGEDSVHAVIRGALRGAALNPSSATVQLAGVAGPSGALTRVDLSYRHDISFLHRLSAGTAGGGLNLSASVVMRHE